MPSIPKPVKSKSCRLCPKPRYGLSRVCFQHWKEKAREKKEASRLKKLDRKLNSKSHQQSELKKWHRKTWKLMSEWVRRSRADWRGMTECYTCGGRQPWVELHAGHHFHRKLDFDERNLRPQCVSCNTYKGGMLNIYARKLIETFGLPWYQQLESDAARHPGYQLHELKAIHEDLTARLKNLPQ
jgi:hypothetical protein